MAFYLENVSGVEAFVSLESFVTIGSNVGDYVEIKGFANSGNPASNYRIVGRSTSTSFTSLLEVGDSGVFFRANTTGGVSFDEGYTQPPVGSDFILRLERVSSSEYECFIDGISIGVRTQVNNFPFDQFFRFDSGGRGESFLGSIYYVEASVDGGLSSHIYMDPSASNGTGSILPDTAGANDGTLVNFPTDDSQWVFYEDGGGEFISELTPRTETGQLQTLALSAGSIQAATPASSTAQTVNLFTVAGNNQPADLITDNSQTQLQQLISGFSVALLPASDNSATQELGFIGGVKDDLIVALVPAADASALQDLQARLGQLQQATPETDSSTLMTLNLVAGTSVPFSAVLSPGVDSAALQAQGFVAGLSAESEPATDTHGIVTLDDRAGQVISLDPAIESSITQTLGLFTGVVIGKFTRSSVLELSPQYSVSELSTAYDIIEQTPVYSVKEI